jgi:hypothetical protein
MGAFRGRLVGCSSPRPLQLRAMAAAAPRDRPLATQSLPPRPLPSSRACKSASAPTCCGGATSSRPRWTRRRPRVRVAEGPSRRGRACCEGPRRDEIPGFKRLTRRRRFLPVRPRRRRCRARGPARRAGARERGGRGGGAAAGRGRGQGGGGGGQGGPRRRARFEGPTGSGCAGQPPSSPHRPTALPHASPSPQAKAAEREREGLADVVKRAGDAGSGEAAAADALAAKAAAAKQRADDLSRCAPAARASRRLCAPRCVNPSAPSTRRLFLRHATRRTCPPLHPLPHPPGASRSWARCRRRRLRSTAARTPRWGGGWGGRR